ncbi:hypothetical protein SCLAR_v1c02810 [Spiroplasma clarkii]|uniref:Uncharacterized protein n=1 Tax=Spiroplasma clarkii TaxID=2139 RepID=A0A2K8KK81_9MOLU|nr:hypothetical protein SCLAR_v1c02810 [Spiroplasma clarkii]
MVQNYEKVYNNMELGNGENIWIEQTASLYLESFYYQQL